MIDAYELLREKETAILRLRQEIEALRCVIPLLLDDPVALDQELERLLNQNSHENGPDGRADAARLGS